MEQYSFQYHTIKLTISSTMLKIILFLLHIVFGLTQDCSVVSDPLVFDGLFYLNSNPDLMDAGMNSVEDARNHWCNNGISEQRQASSMFHAPQYLERYPDLSEDFGEDYRRATEHYVLKGFEEKRVGYLEGGARNRWTVRGGEIAGTRVYVSTSDRVAGAVDSLVWANKEFINNFDHGRQLQLAVTVPPYGECWNPTEAGGSADYIWDETSSIIQSIEASGNVLKTVNHPGYWYEPGRVSGKNGSSKCQEGDVARNELVTHPFDLAKNVTIGCFGMENCIQWVMDAALGSGYGMPTDYNYAQLEGPTAYCMADFTEAKRWNYDTGELVDASTGEMIYPVIIHTQDEQYSLGAYAHPDEQLYIELRYAYFNFGGRPFHQATYKWSVVWRESKQPNESISRTSWICVGNLTMTTECLANVRAALLDEHQ